MSVERPTVSCRPARDPVVAWRMERLSEVGVPDQLAQTVAADGAYDLHAFLTLADRGCPPELAVRILAPLDDRSYPC